MSAQNKGSILVSVILVLVIVASINLLASRFFTRLDLTERKEYTISDSSRDVLSQLDDVVNVKAYFSQDLPPYLATLDRQVKDLLDEYRARSGNRLGVEFLDPAIDPATERSVIQMGIPKVQLNIIEKDKAEVTGAFLGIAVQYEDKTEVIPVIQSVANLEYDLTSAILKVTSEAQTVGVAGSGELSLNQGLQGLQAVLAQQYILKPVSLNSGPVPDDVSSLIVIDHDDLTPSALYHVDQFLMRGGRVLACVPGVQLAMQTLSASDRQPKLGPQLRTYGVQVQSNLVADGQSAMASFSQGYMSFTVPYPWWPQVTRDNVSPDNPITATLDGLVFPWTSPVGFVDGDSLGEGYDVLVKTSTRSFAAGPPYDLNPQSRLTLPGQGVEPQTLAVAISGSFKSHWAGQPAPMDSLAGGTPTPPLEQSPETQLVVVGSAHFLNDQFMQQFPSNSVFAANIVDWMTLGNALIEIRSKGVTSRPLKEVEDSKRNLYKYLAILGVPILVVVAGLVRNRVRKNRRMSLAQEYGGLA
ncbi:MAG: GldG family protein [Candidatus Eisenbacteria bacterium]|uniref:GldG family protein n=1 Tax=Eiseniibacteriota bacterium TaxID=2212470 RepID=A0A7Y2E9F8_UNCEI|nr:GldG family protein [Candidatus Eisenbacteria bacterium]